MRWTIRVAFTPGDSVSVPGRPEAVTLGRMDDETERHAMKTLDRAALQRYVCAHHEAAHTIARLVFGASFYELVLYPGEDGLGVSRGYPEGFEQPWPAAETSALVGMAGPAVESYFYSMRFGRRKSDQELFQTWYADQHLDNDDREPGPKSDTVAADWRAGWAFVICEAMVEIYGTEIKALATELLIVGRIGREDLGRVLPGFAPDEKLVMAAVAAADRQSFVDAWLEYLPEASQ
jgi:hypothetical protein